MRECSFVVNEDIEGVIFKLIGEDIEGANFGSVKT